MSVMIFSVSMIASRLNLDLYEMPIMILSSVLMKTSSLNLDPLEESNFSLRYVRLCNLDIPREKWLNYFQTVVILIRCCICRYAPFAIYALWGLQTKMGERLLQVYILIPMKCLL